MQSGQAAFHLSPGMRRGSALQAKIGPSYLNGLSQPLVPGRPSFCTPQKPAFNELENPLYKRVGDYATRRDGKIGRFWT